MYFALLMLKDYPQSSSWQRQLTVVIFTLKMTFCMTGTYSFGEFIQWENIGLLSVHTQQTEDTLTAHRELWEFTAHNKNYSNILANIYIENLFTSIE